MRAFLLLIVMVILIITGMIAYEVSSVKTSFDSPFLPSGEFPVVALILLAFLSGAILSSLLMASFVLIPLYLQTASLRRKLGRHDEELKKLRVAALKEIS